jgi:N-acetylmuramoyl-L-alanine amidase
VLFESANMRNAADAALLVEPSFRQRIARALADGLQRYLRS